MAARLSRRKIAAHVADSLIDGKKAGDIMRTVAAYLVDTRRTRELELLVRDIETALSERGVIVADIASAHPLSAALRQEVAKMVGGKSVQLRETIDPTLLGGIRIDTPGKRFDGTVRRKLTALRAKQL
jgi:F-type H+-transporting ATPase subunit delta